MPSVEQQRADVARLNEAYGLAVGRLGEAMTVTLQKEGRGAVVGELGSSAFVLDADAGLVHFSVNDAANAGRRIETSMVLAQIRRTPTDDGLTDGTTTLTFAGLAALRRKAPRPGPTASWWESIFGQRTWTPPPAPKPPRTTKPATTPKKPRAKKAK